MTGRRLQQPPTRFAKAPAVIDRVKFAAVIVAIVTSAQFTGDLIAATPPSAIEERGAFGQGSGSVATAITFFEKRVERSERDFLSRTILGGLYQRAARELGDGRYYDRAEDTLREALATNPNHHRAKLRLSSVMLAQHQFATALALARSVPDAVRESPDALAILGDAYLAVGRYDDAENVFKRLPDALSDPAVLARLATIDEVRGRMDAAAQHWKKALEDARRRKQTPRQVAWYAAQQARLDWQEGRVDEAEAKWQFVRKAAAGDIDAVVGLAHIHGSRNEFAAAEELARMTLDSRDDPRLYELLGDLLVAQNKPRDANLMYAVAATHYELRPQDTESGSTPPSQNETRHAHSHRYPDAHRRALVRLSCRRQSGLENARRLAEADLAIRQDVDAFDTLAWVLYQLGEPEQAKRKLARALRWGTKDPTLHFHAAVIAHELGQTETAKKHLSEVTRRNAHFSLADRRQLLELVEALR